MKIYPDRLKEAMYKRGFWNIAAFSRACGVARPTISSILNGRYKSDSRDETIMLICNALNVTPEYLAGKECFPEGNTKEDQTARALFDLLVTAGKIEPPRNDSGLFRLSSTAGTVDISGSEMQALIRIIQRRLDSMCDEYIELCAIRGETSK